MRLYPIPNGAKLVNTNLTKEQARDKAIKIFEILDTRYHWTVTREEYLALIENTKSFEFFTHNDREFKCYYVIFYGYGCSNVTSRRFIRRAKTKNELMVDLRLNKKYLAKERKLRDKDCIEWHEYEITKIKEIMIKRGY